MTARMARWWGASILVLVGGPLLLLAVQSLGHGWFFPALWPNQWSWRAWASVWTGSGGQVRAGLAGSLTVAALVALASVTIGLPAGRALGLYRFRAKQAVSLLLALPLIVPPLSVSMGLHVWFLRLGLAETLPGVVLVHLSFCLPYAVFTLAGVFAGFDPELEEQARSLGASRWRVLRLVTLPAVLPGVAIGALFAFLLSWSQYLCTLIIGGGRITTLPLALFGLMASGDRPVAAAVSLVFTAPAVLILLQGVRFLGQRRPLLGVG
jgi:putative spermidine/putrescine transport system permease protein